MSFINNYMTNLITNKYYKTREEAENKVMAFYAVDKLTDDEFIALMLIIEEKYPA